MFLLAQLPSLHSGAHSFLPDQNLTSESDQSSVDCCKMPSLKSTRETLFLRLKCVWCVCVCLRVCGALQNRQAKYTLSFGRVQTIKCFTKHVKTAGLESIHLKHSLYLKVNLNSWEKIVCQYFVFVTDWSFFNVNQRIKHRENQSQLLI